jgi:hypothetical protein
MYTSTNNFDTNLFKWSNGCYLLILVLLCDFSNRSKLLFFDITSCIVGVTTFTFVCPTTQVCVSECPDENYNYRYHYYNRDSQVETLKEWPQTNKIYCRKDKTLKDVLDDEGDYNPVCSLFLLLVLCHTCFVII